MRTTSRMSSTRPSSSVPMACSLKRTLSCACRRRCISAMYSLALADCRPNAITVRSAVAMTSDPNGRALGAAVAQQRRRAVALFAVALPQPIHRRQHVVEAELTPELDRALRPVEAELHAGIDVFGRADALAEREQGLVDDAALDPVEQLGFGRVQLGARIVVGPMRSVAVVVPAAPGLPPQAAGSDHLGLQRIRPPARLAERQLRERLRDGEADVDAHEVHQLERTHPVAAANAIDPVDVLDRGDALLQQSQRLAAEWSAVAVHQEAGAVGGVD